jgi:hypothetical protein
MDLLIQAGGFGMVAVDLSDVPTRTVRQVPLNAWFRFRRAIEDTPTILLMIEQESNAKTCASLVLRLEMAEARWAAASEKSNFYSFAKLLRGFAVGGDVIRSRMQIPERRVVDIRAGEQPRLRGQAKMAGPRVMFETETVWRSR